MSVLDAVHILLRCPVDIFRNIFDRLPLSYQNLIRIECAGIPGQYDIEIYDGEVMRVSIMAQYFREKFERLNLSWAQHRRINNYRNPHSFSNYAEMVLHRFTCSSCHHCDYDIFDQHMENLTKLRGFRCDACINDSFVCIKCRYSSCDVGEFIIFDDDPPEFRSADLEPNMIIMCVFECSIAAIVYNKYYLFIIST
jgi:hypothetical protein